VRVLLVGPVSDRGRLRRQLERAGIHVVGEFVTLALARQAGADVDAIVVTADGSGTAEPGEPPEPADEAPVHEVESGMDDGEDLPEPLTARERQVLELLAEGLPNKKIAERLGISDQTVKFHVASICGKLGASNRTDAVRLAFRRGLITI
jgi:DNA-binding NarL/FixJ family response regulator